MPGIFPLNVKKAFFLHIGHIGTILGMNGHPSAPTDIPDDGITWNRIATLGEPDKNILDPSDLDGVRTRFLFLSGPGSFLLSGSLFNAFRLQFLLGQELV
jgi:hypothetical protein